MIMTPDKAKFLAAALDTHVKTHGLSVAGSAAALFMEIQADLRQTIQETQPVKEDETAET